MVHGMALTSAFGVRSLSQDLLQKLSRLSIGDRFTRKKHDLVHYGWLGNEDLDRQPPNVFRCSERDGIVNATPLEHK